MTDSTHDFFVILAKILLRMVLPVVLQGLTSRRNEGRMIALATRCGVSRGTFGSNFLGCDGSARTKSAHGWVLS